MQDQFGGYEEAMVAPDAARALAEAALGTTSSITQTAALAYARVDMLRDGRGSFRLMELELIEPSLFLRFAPDKGVAFAEAIKRVAQLSARQAVLLEKDNDQF